MFKLWSMLQSSICSPDTLRESFESKIGAFRQPVIGYFKSKSETTSSVNIKNPKITQLKPNENELLKKIATSLVSISSTLDYNGNT